jgi:hypothetical protein
MSAVAPAKGNLVIDESNESMIGDGDAMSVMIYREEFGCTIGLGALYNYSLVRTK